MYRSQNTSIYINKSTIVTMPNDSKCAVPDVLIKCDGKTILIPKFGTTTVAGKIDKITDLNGNILYLRAARKYKAGNLVITGNEDSLKDYPADELMTCDTVAKVNDWITKYNAASRNVKPQIAWGKTSLIATMDINIGDEIIFSRGVQHWLFTTIYGHALPRVKLACCLKSIDNGHFPSMMSPSSPYIDSTMNCTIKDGDEYAEYYAMVMQKAFKFLDYGLEYWILENMICRGIPVEYAKKIANVTAYPTQENIKKFYHNYCSYCSKENPPMKCSGCLVVHYCDRECQTNHWPKHKAEFRH